MCREEEEETELSRSIYKLMSGVKLGRFIISPYDHRYRAWNSFIILLVFYTAWVSPFELGFLQRPTRGLSIVDNIINGFFAVDIVMTFFVSYLDRATYLLVDDRKQIAWKYARTWLVLDVISTIPYEVGRMMLPQSLDDYAYFNLLRIWRLRRLSSKFARLEKDTRFSYFTVRCAKLVIVTLFAIHWAGCFYYLLAASYHDPKQTWIGASVSNFHQTSLWIRYLRSIYWSTLTAVGSGDSNAQNPPEMIFSIFYALFSLGLTTYLIGNFTNLVVHGTHRTREYRDTIQVASQFAQRNRLPNGLQDQMLAHLCLKFRTNSEGLVQQQILEALPRTIRSSISHYLFYSLVDRAYLFRGVSNDLLFQLVSEMKPEYFPPKVDVILQNEVPTDFYIVISGTVELVVFRNGTEQVVGEAKSGDVCGEVGLICNMPQLFTIRTKRLSQMLRLNRTSFLNILQSRTGDGTIVMNNLLQRLKEMNDPIMEGVLLETENLLTRGRMDLPVSVCFAVDRGDDIMLSQLLKQGLDPNESNNNGRTPLHIAASIGSENCVRLLLDYKADPNSVDSEGNVPLWEAILGNHETLMNLLRDYGATLDNCDVSQFACTAVEQNSLEMLKKIVQYGGDVRTPTGRNGTTALHVAVMEANTVIINFLLDQGADMDKPDTHGWTPRNLADQMGQVIQ